MIEIVTHVYAGTLPQYAVFLRAHLSSIVLDGDDAEVRVTVCYTKQDTKVVEVLDEFEPLLVDRLKRLELEPGHLFRRCIGRNKAARRTEADLVWFCDVDHVFGPGCLSGLWDVWRYWKGDLPVMFWPGEILIHRDHAVGDAYWKAHVASTGVISIDPRDFALKRYHKAIGGVQIVDGAFCRLMGYLNNHRKWLSPVSGDKPFPDFRDDVVARKIYQAAGSVVKIEIPNLYRLRHTEVTYKGS